MTQHGPQTEPTDRPIRIALWGLFKVTDADGADLTPRLMKCQALLALLATSRDGERARRWLQARLWGDRSREQASGSLRQALAAIRKAFGAHADLISADRNRVRLDLSRVVLEDPVSGDEFLAGFDDRDENFEDWLRLERAARLNATGTPPPNEPPRTPPVGAPPVAPQAPEKSAVVLTGGAPAASPTEAVETFVIDSVARSLRENFSVRTYTHQAPKDEPDALRVSILASQTVPNQMYLSARCSSDKSAELLWTGNQVVRLAGAFPFEDLDVLSWVNEIVSAIAEYLGRDPKVGAEGRNATHLGLAALRELFSMDPTRVAEADRMLAEAYEIDPRAVFLGWRAQLRGIQYVERHSADAEALREEGLALAQKALEAEPHNSSVLATIANARQILDGDMYACDELSRQSVKENPSNPLAWWARALVHIYSDRGDDALQASQMGQHLARGSPYGFWWDMQVSLSSIAARRIEQAIQSAERAATFSSNFRPPMRYLVGLHAQHGSRERALHWARKLRELEPDFLPERLIKDGGYPASRLRRSGIIGDTSIEALQDMASDG